MTDPEIRIEQLQPIDFAPNDDDRVKDVFKEMYLLEYAYSRDANGLDWDEACAYAVESAALAAKHYREWLKEQAS